MSTPAQTAGAKLDEIAKWAKLTFFAAAAGSAVTIGACFYMVEEYLRIKWAIVDAQAEVAKNFKNVQASFKPFK